MLIALYGKKDFLAREILVERRGGWGLRFVPLAVVLRLGMNVVCGGVAVDDLEVLSRHHAKHVWVVPAAALVERDRVLGDVKSAPAEAFLHVDEDVGEMAAASHNIFGHVCAFAGGVLSHVD